NSLLAVSLFSEITKKFNKQLPVPVLLQAPTVAQLAGVLRQDGWVPPRTVLVPLQAGGSKPPFFYVPPIGSTALSAVRYIPYQSPDQPFYGLQPLGFEEGETPHDRVEDMAAYYIKEIRSIQPEGPYYLGGQCYGCTIVFEMAQQLQAQGYPVALLALLDQVSPLRAAVPAPLLKRIYAYSRRIIYEHSYGNLSWAFVMESFYRRFNTLRRMKEIKKQFEPQELRIKHVMDAHFGAVMSYIPQSYPGKITLLQNRESYIMEQKGFLTRRWVDLAEGEFDCRVVEGNHWTIFNQESLFQPLAEQLKNCLEEAQDSQ
ncbi:MAG: hypothetical protein D3923_18365, partial [Candidatus Electrothrix sp. AR3]|nr:hypothetical protein [Candidatus Electrothrix sp. AR3]